MTPEPERPRPAARRARRIQMLGGRPFRLPPRCANCDGYGLHAGVVIGAGKRAGLERLGRYIARPPLAKTRLEERTDGDLCITLKRPWAEGTTAIVLSRLELLERLAALVPPPRANQILYHGVLAPRSALRSAIAGGSSSSATAAGWPIRALRTLRSRWAGATRPVRGSRKTWLKRCGGTERLPNREPPTPSGRWTIWQLLRGAKRVLNAYFGHGVR